MGIQRWQIVLVYHRNKSIPEKRGIFKENPMALDPISSSTSWIVAKLTPIPLKLDMTGESVTVHGLY